MIDTGNLLKEPITNTSVIIVEGSLMEGIVAEEILDNLDDILVGKFDKIPEEIQQEYITKLKCIPFSSLGKQNGMLIGMKAEGVEIARDDEIKKNDNVIIGIYNKSLTKRGEYRALVGIEMI